MVSLEWIKMSTLNPKFSEILVAIDGSESFAVVTVTHDLM